jgi:hypothetical protein
MAGMPHSNGASTAHQTFPVLKHHCTCGNKRRHREGAAIPVIFVPLCSRYFCPNFPTTAAPLSLDAAKYASGLADKFSLFSVFGLI